MNYEEQAKIAYANDSEKKRRKAIASGIALDNGLKKEYTQEGITHCRFHAAQYEAYFSPEALGHRSSLLI